MALMDQLRSGVATGNTKPTGSSTVKAREVVALAQPPRPLRTMSNPKGRKTYDDLENDQRFQDAAHKFTDWLGTNDDIFETLRDQDMKLTDAAMLAMKADAMPEDVKKAYAYVKQETENADLGSFNQWMEAVKDIGIDVITDPINIATMFAAPFTSGASVAARAAAGAAAKAGAKRLLAAKLGAAEGLIWGGAQSYAGETTKEAVGLNEGVSATKVLSSAAIGGVAGGLLGRFIDGNTLAKKDRVFSETRYNEKNRILFGEQAVADAQSLFGKAATVLDPAAKISPKAASLQKIFRYDLGKDINWFTLDRKERPIAKDDYNKIVEQLNGGFLQEYDKAVAPIRFNGRVMANDTKEALAQAVRMGPEKAKDAGIAEDVIDASKKVRALLDKRGYELLDAGLISTDKPSTVVFNGATTTEYKALPVDNFVPRRWKREVIEKNRTELEQLFLKYGQSATPEDSKKLVDGLLDIKNQIHTPAGNVFNAPRSLLEVDDAAFSKFLDNDFNAIMHEYGHQTSVKLGAVKAFGTKNEAEFIEKWIKPIADDYAKAGMEMPEKLRKNILKLYQFSTGEGLEYFGRRGQAMKDWASLTYQMSLLPLATLSSLSEIVLPLARVDTPTYMKGVAQGIGAGVKDLTVGVLDKLKVKHNMDRSQAIRELNSVSIALEEAIGDGFERLTGEGIKGGVAQSIQRGFFKANLLTPWTHFVQKAAFIMGKDKVRKNLSWLATSNNLDNNTAIRIKNELSDLGVDYNKGIEWLKTGAKEDDPFYQQVVKAGARFVEEITPSTSKRSGTVPLYMSDPKMDILFQFMRFPAAFNSVVLKRMVEDFAEAPVRGGAKVLSAGIIMTLMARVLNFARTDGASEEGVSEGEANYKALARWGGNGMIFDLLTRAQKAGETFGTPLAAPIGLFGPIVGDAASVLTFRKGPAQFIGQKVPGYSAGYAVFGQEPMDDYNTWLRAKDKQIAEMFAKNFSASKKNRPSGGFSR